MCTGRATPLWWRSWRRTWWRSLAPWCCQWGAEACWTEWWRACAVPAGTTCPLWPWRRSELTASMQQWRPESWSLYPRSPGEKTEGKKESNWRLLSGSSLPKSLRLLPPLPSSVATTLGLTRVSAQTLKLVNEHTVFSEVVSDQEAVKAVERFVGESWSGGRWC